MKSKKTVSCTPLLALALHAAGSLFSSTSWAVPIAIIDSGTDLKHPDLVSKAWTNPGNLADDAYTDDLHGWNFADHNNQIIDYQFMGKFSPDVYRYFDIQLRALNGSATEEDRKWMKEKKSDEKFILELETFGNFVHGTHVAGISAHSAEHAQIMAAKIIPTEVKTPRQLFLSPEFLFDFQFKPWDFHPLSDFALSLVLGLAADQQAHQLAEIGKYVHTTQMAAANCSFGTGLEQATRVVSILAKKILKRTLTDQEADRFGREFLQKMIEKGAVFAQSAPKTLFVIAAGNDGTNNDEKPTFPANLKLENTITVAATRGYEKLASFSNYGNQQVEIAAPGVGIVSSIPGDGSIALSGTSQASPFVANLAGRILDANPALTLVQVKKILMGTVDKKPFLAGKIVSGGIANADRALRAAALSTSQNLEQSIERARSEIADVKTLMTIESIDSFDGDPLPMPSLF